MVSPILLVRSNFSFLKRCVSLKRARFLDTRFSEQLLLSRYAVVLIAEEDLARGSNYGFSTLGPFYLESIEGFLVLETNSPVGFFVHLSFVDSNNLNRYQDKEHCCCDPKGLQRMTAKDACCNG